MKTNRIFYKILWLLWLPVFPAFSAGNDPQAIQWLDKVSDAYRKAGGVTAGFTLEIRDLSAPGSMESFTGEIKMKGKCFYIDTPDMRTWFDGKTQWAMLKTVNEVNISEPTEEELQAVNPYVLLQLYKNGYAAVFAKESTTGQPVIELIPEDKSSTLEKIRVTIDTKHLFPSTIELVNKNGTTNLIRITKYRSGMNYTDEQFVFDKKACPDAELIDLR